MIELLLIFHDGKHAEVLHITKHECPRPTITIPLTLQLQRKTKSVVILLTDETTRFPTIVYCRS